MIKNIAIASLIAATGIAAAGVPGVQITEVFTGLSGEDGTQDWIEVTWFGAGTFDTAGLVYDDSNPSLANGGQLTSFILNTGESAVFLLSDIPVDDLAYNTALEEFAAIWGNVANVGLTNGGGNLGQGGDSANILDLNGNLVDSLAYEASGDLATFERVGAVIRLSVAGENGAYTSAEFFNDNLGLPNDTATLVGSPGLIPAPAALAVLGMGGIAAGRRRRN